MLNKKYELALYHFAEERQKKLVGGAATPPHLRSNPKVYAVAGFTLSRVINLSQSGSFSNFNKVKYDKKRKKKNRK